MRKLLPSFGGVRDNAWYDLLKWGVISLVALLAALGWTVYRYDLGPVVLWATLLSLGWLSFAIGFLRHLRRTVIAPTVELSTWTQQHSEEVDRRLEGLHTACLEIKEELGRISRLLTPLPTSDGMNWRLLDHMGKNGKAQAVLRIWSVGELPQPLELEIQCAGCIADARPKFFLDASRLSWDNSDLEMGPLGSSTLQIRLGSPKLHAPTFLEIVLLLSGTDWVQVIQIVRSPTPNATCLIRAVDNQ